MARDTIFVTGAGGLIGRELLAAVRTDGVERVRALSRREQHAVAGDEHVEWIRGDLTEPSAWAARLEGCSAVVHLGASTGRAAASVHLSVNLEGTRALIRAARDARVPRFVFASTIAATYPEVERYPYAAAKREAEAAVRASTLQWTILRPTIVLGAAGGAGPALLGFARRARTPVFGDGSVRVQPIGARDTARLFLEATRDAGTVREALDLGGPDVLTFLELLSRLRSAVGREPGRFLHLPLRPALSAAWALERLLGPRLPVLAGQLYSFRYDSTAQRSAFLDARMPRLARIDAVIAELVAGTGKARHE